MENDNYSKISYLRIKKKKVNYLTISIVILVFGLAFLGLSALFINPSSVNIVKLVDSLVVSLSTLTACFFFIEGFWPAKRRADLLYRLLTVDRYEGEIKIIDIHSPYLVRKGIEAYEIEAEDEEGKRINCYLESNVENDLEIGKTYKVILAMNFIIGEKRVDNE